MLAEHTAWLRIAAAPSLRPALLDELLRRFGSAGAIVAARARELAASGLAEAAVAALHDDSRDSECERLERWLARGDRSLVTWTDARYPPLLRAIPDAPALIYVHGNADCLSLPHLAMVGSRNPTRGGEATARAFAGELVRAGLGIVSGLAHGIDAAAHEGALEAGGITIAVLGTGVDRIYPRSNHALAHRIAETGALLAEFPLGTPPRKHHFPRRNRLISGLALGTLVVEAAERSGSLITARLAAEQGREVFAIPGSIHNPMARGCHRLLRDGARLVESTADIFPELAVLAGSLLDLPEPAGGDTAATRECAKALDADYAAVLDALGWEPVSVDDVARRCGLTIAEVSSMLLILELEGIVEALPGNRYARLGRERKNP